MLKYVNHMGDIMSQKRSPFKGQFIHWWHF